MRTYKPAPIEEIVTNPPHNNAAEINLISSLLVNFDRAASVVGDLQPNDFYNSENKKIFGVIYDLIKQGSVPDIAAVGAELFKTYPAEAVELFAHAQSGETTYTGMERLADEVQACSTRRKGIIAGWQIVQRFNDQTSPIDEAQALSLADVTKVSEHGRDDTKTMRDAWQDLKHLIERNKNADGFAGFPTLATFDAGQFYNGTKAEGYGGFMPTELNVLAAGTGSGKTALAVTIALQVARIGKIPTAYYSFEIKAAQLFARMLAPAAEVSTNVLLKKNLTPLQDDLIQKNLHRIADLPIYFDDNFNNRTAEHIISSIRRMHARHGVRFVVIDYLQLVKAGATDRNQTEESRLADTARAFKNLALELDICVLLLSQFNVDKEQMRGAQMPTLDRLRGSGQIAEAADNVLLMLRMKPQEIAEGMKYPKPFADVATEGTAVVEWAKVRNGEPARFVVGWRGDYSQVYDLTEIPARQANKYDDPFL